jgi:Mg-chelatase subunit ChlD
MSTALWLASLACLAATVAWVVLRARPAAAAIPLPRRDGLAPALRRSRIVSLAAAAVLVAATLGLAMTTRTSTPGRQVLPAGSTAMIVLDLSDSTTRYFTQIAGTLDSLTRESNRHLGLVVDSNTAYVALPPTTPVEGLRGWLHAFVRSPFLAYPWKGTFSQGTELSKGLVVARAALRQAHIRNPHVVLVTDLSDDTFDLQRLSAVVTQYQREHIDLRIVSLGENQSASTKLATPNWHNAAYIARAASTVASPLSRDGVATHRPSLVPVALLLLLTVLAATVLAAGFHPLRWRTA